MPSCATSFVGPGENGVCVPPSAIRPRHHQPFDHPAWVARCLWLFSASGPFGCLGCTFDFVRYVVRGARREWGVCAPISHSTILPGSHVALPCLGRATPSSFLGRTCRLALKVAHGSRVWGRWCGGRGESFPPPQNLVWVTRDAVFRARVPCLGCTFTLRGALLCVGSLP